MSTFRPKDCRRRCLNGVGGMPSKDCGMKQMKFNRMAKISLKEECKTKPPSIRQTSSAGILGPLN